MNPTEPTAAQRTALAALIVLGVATALFYFTWWLARPLGLVGDTILVLSLLFHTAQVFVPWWLLLKSRKRAPCTAPPELTVDVFVTAFREPAELVRRSLAAAVAMRHPHETFLLDDGDRSELRAIAEELGARYIARPGNQDAKAGNLNHALTYTSGDVVVVLDADHTPRPEFLERSLGYFADPEIGFVQVMLSFRNERAGFVARAAAELADDFFNTVSLGMDAVDACTLFGSNALIRRRALERIGGYQPGLAEDLATSLELHGAGWRSAMVPEPLAPGLVPPDLRAFFTQQFKWARGVFEELLVRYPRVFFALTWSQRLAYLTRMTFYTAGLYTAVHLFIAWNLLFGATAYHELFASYFVRYVPLLCMIFVVESYAIRMWTGRYHLKLRGTSLAYGTWPVYLWAWMLAVFRARVRHLVTRKHRERGNALPLVTPQLMASAVTAAGVLWLLAQDGSATGPTLTLVTFAVFLIGMHGSVWVGAAENARAPEG